MLRRIIDRPFIEGLRAVRDPAERARRVLEIAASDDLQIEQMFPYLCELRAELAAIVRAGTSEPRARSDGSSPADHAARLLAYWADPADDVLVVPWRLRVKNCITAQFVTVFFGLLGQQSRQIHRKQPLSVRHRS